MHLDLLLFRIICQIICRIAIWTIHIICERWCVVYDFYFVFKDFKNLPKYSEFCCKDFTNVCLLY